MGTSTLPERLTTTRTLVLYSGPHAHNGSRASLYDRNLRFFLRHGLPCSQQTDSTGNANTCIASRVRVLITLTPQSAPHYSHLVHQSAGRTRCCEQSVDIVVRPNRCNDMGSAAAVRVSCAARYGHMEQYRALPLCRSLIQNTST